MEETRAETKLIYGSINLQKHYSCNYDQNVVLSSTFSTRSAHQTSCQICIFISTGLFFMIMTSDIISVTMIQSLNYKL